LVAIVLAEMAVSEHDRFKRSRMNSVEAFESETRMVSIEMVIEFLFPISLKKYRILVNATQLLFLQFVGIHCGSVIGAR
jgi:hypothetical protein